METVLYLGINVSKDSLVCCLRPLRGRDREASFSNSESGIKELLGWIGDVSTVIAKLEATSRYHRAVARALGEAGATVEVMNPARAHALGVALGLLDKDDKIDARTLAEAARLLARKVTQLRSKAHEELRDLSRLITTLTTDNAVNKKRLEALEKGSKAYVRLGHAIKAIAAQIKAAKKEWLQLLKSDEALKGRYELAMSYKDVGPETARIVVCELPSSLDEYRNDQICGYAAVVPRKNESGLKKGKEKAGKAGNAHLRTGLYMAATRAALISKTQNDFYLKLRAKGKTHKQAIVAVIHRIVRGMVAVRKRGTPWTPEPPAP